MQITIDKNENGTFNVSTDGKLADSLCFDEMLGLIAVITMPLYRPCLGYLKTPEQIKAWDEKYAVNIPVQQGEISEVNFENIT